MRTKLRANTVIFAFLSLVLGLVSGFVLALAALFTGIFVCVGLIHILEPFIYLVPPGRLMDTAVVSFSVILGVTAAITNFFWVLITSSLGKSSRVASAWSLAIGASSGFIQSNIGFYPDKISPVSYTSIVAMGILGLLVGALYVTNRYIQEQLTEKISK